MVTVWQQINSPDHFTTLCTLSNYGVPNNDFGSLFPKNGNAYIGISCYNFGIEGKEYIYQQLTNPLILGKSYYTSFFLSKSDRARIATEKIGAYFSVSQPTVASSMDAFLATPQVENHSGFLTDTVNWVKIEGYFTAQGGEQYITIGNFNSNADTDTLHTGTTNPFFMDAGTAYYYIDSVSLYDSLDYALITNIKKMEDNFKVNLYPNPTTSKLKLSIQNLKNEQLGIKITDVLGREVKTLEYEEEIDLSDLENGIYFLSLYQNKQVLTTKKIIKQ